MVPLWVLLIFEETLEEISPAINLPASPKTIQLDNPGPTHFQRAVKVYGSF